MQSVSVLLLLCAVLVMSCSHQVSAQRDFIQIIPTTDQWSARADAALEVVAGTTTFRDGLTGGRAVSLTNYFLLYGGITDEGPANDVWASGNGRNWIWAAGTADGEEHPFYADSFPPRLYGSHTRDQAHRQVVAAGISLQIRSILNDVWSTVQNSSSRWVRMTGSAQWSQRYGASLVADPEGPAGRLFIAGGFGVSAGRAAVFADVWGSTNGGVGWTQLTASGDWPPGRGLAVLLSSAGSRVTWLTGVNITGDEMGVAVNDVWRSGTVGSWTRLAAQAPFSARFAASGRRLNFSDGLLVLGGVSTTRTDANDVWVSLNAGTDWGLCVSSAEWGGRVLQFAAIDSDGFLWVMGGGGNLNDTRPMSDIWRSVTRYNNATELQSRCNKRLPSAAASDSRSPRPTSLLTKTLARIQEMLTKKTSRVTLQ